MKGLIFLAYEVLCSLGIFLILMMVFRKSHNEEKVKKSYYLYLIAFGIYIVGVYHFTGTGTMYDLIIRGFKVNMNKINLRPFSNSIDIIGYMLNIVMFIPFGFFIGKLWKRGFLSVVLSSACFSLLIELSQIINNRATDIDDLLVNTFGGIIGYIIYSLCKKENQIRSRNILEPTIYIVSMFVARFFLFNEMQMAKFLYGF